jgi:hypothetical protein
MIQEFLIRDYLIRDYLILANFVAPFVPFFFMAEKKTFFIVFSSSLHFLSLLDASSRY